MSQFNFKFYYGNQGSEDRELELLRFTGHENISQLFDFDLELKSIDTDLDEDGVINKRCCLEIYYGQGCGPVRVIHGLINEFEDVNYLPDYTLYRAKMVPRIWQLGLFDTNEVYLNETIEQTLTAMLQEAHFVAGQDFRFQLSRIYRTWPFRLQYNETYFDFLQRIIEREGIYYYFEHNNGREVMVFCDNNNQLSAIVQSDQAQTVRFQSNSGINVATGANTVNSIICKRQTLPRKITLRDFNDENPSLDIRGESEINSAGVGAINLYGLNITSPEEGQALADIHANAFLCRQKSYIGQGDVATMSAGHTFALHNHPKNSFNELEYVIESIEHEGANPNHYVGLNTEDEAPVNYSNSFTALSTAVQFAPKRQTVAREINTTLNAVVDAEAQSGYAELDAYGRYKIKLPFDTKDREAGRASHWVRMMQPYGGVGSGMHFPLRAGTRVLLAFVGGDPDRPFISGTIDDSGDQQSIVTADNQTNSMIKTASGNKIEIEDMEGTHRIKLQTGDNKTYMHLGAPNHVGDGWVVVTDGMERKFIRGGQNIVVATRNLLDSEIDRLNAAVVSAQAAVVDLTATATPAERTSATATLTTAQAAVASHAETERRQLFLGDAAVVSAQAAVDGLTATATATPAERTSATDTLTAAQTAATTALSDLNFTGHPQYQFTKRSLDGENQGLCTAGEELDGTNLFYRSLGDVYVWEKGNEYRYNSPGDTQFKFGIDKVISVSQKDGNLDAFYTKKSDSKFSDNQRFNRDLDGADELSQKILNLREGLKGYQCFHEPSPGADRTKFTNQVPVREWNDLLDNKSMVTIGRHNTFNIQEGNIFDFGGYWSYHLGNSYTETHGDVDTEINRLAPHDLAETAGPHWGSINDVPHSIVTLKESSDEDLVAVNNAVVSAQAAVDGLTATATPAERTSATDTLKAAQTAKRDAANDEHVEKNYNDRYTYTLGGILEVQKGNFESKIFGDVKEYTEGTFTSQHSGTYKEEHDERTLITHGDHHTITKGANRDDYFGAYAAFFAGAKSDISAGASSEMFLGVTSAITLGAESTVNLGLVSNVTLAAQLVLNAGYVSDIRAEGEAKVVAAAIEAAEAKCANFQMSASVSINEINTSIMRVSNRVSSVETSVVAIQEVETVAMWL